MSTPEHAPESSAGGIKRLIGGKVAGVPVWIIIAGVVAVGLFLAMRARNSATADASSVDTGAGPQDYSGSGVVDPGGVSGLDPYAGIGGAGFGGGGFDPMSAGVASGVPSGSGDPTAGGEVLDPVQAQVEFPSGSPITQQPAGARHATSTSNKVKSAPAKARGGRAVPVTPSHSVKSKPPASATRKPPAKKAPAHKPAVATHTPSARKPPAKGRPSAPKRTTGKG